MLQIMLRVFVLGAAVLPAVAPVNMGLAAETNAAAKRDPKAWKLQTRPANPTTCPVGPRSATVQPWRAIFRGIEYTTAETKTPRPLKVHAMRVRGGDPTMEFFVTPCNGQRPGGANAEKATTFLKKHKLQVAINATPWDRLVTKEGEPVKITGLSISRGDLYSRPNDTYGALLISKDNKAWIARPPVNAKRAYNGVGGFRMLLWNGENVAWDDFLHPRTAAGVSEDGRYLYLAVIDGRQPGYSEGTTTGETAEWMRMFGAYNAVNLDGGGSSVMVIDDGHGEAKVLNRPIEGGIPGKERITANHLGIFAKPVDASHKEK